MENKELDTAIFLFYYLYFIIYLLVRKSRTKIYI